LKIKFNAKSDMDLIFLEAGAEEKMRNVIINSLKACVKMETYYISYDLSNIRKDVAVRTRIYTISLSHELDADVIEMLDNALEVSRLTKFLLRCYSFGKGYPDYRLLNLVYMKSHFFNEETFFRPETSELANNSAEAEKSDNDHSSNGLMDLTKMEMM